MTNLGMVLSVSPGISLSPFLTMAKLRTAKLPSTIHPRTDLRLRSPCKDKQVLNYKNYEVGWMVSFFKILFYLHHV